MEKEKAEQIADIMDRYMDECLDIVETPEGVAKILITYGIVALFKIYSSPKETLDSLFSVIKQLRGDFCGGE